MREEFEAWMKQRMLAHGWNEDSVSLVFLPSTIPGLTYSTVSTEHAWIGYQAGALAMRERAAKEVNLETGMRHMAEKIRALPVEE